MQNRDNIFFFFFFWFYRNTDDFGKLGIMSKEQANFKGLLIDVSEPLLLCCSKIKSHGFP